MSLPRYFNRAIFLCREAAESPLALPVALDQLLRRAMVGHDGSATLERGEGPEALRLLRLVAWERVPVSSWIDVLWRLWRVATVRAVQGEAPAAQVEAEAIRWLKGLGFAAEARRG